MSQTGALLGRLLQLITLIQGDRRWRPASLSEHLKVAERTVYRDLQRLKAGGVPVIYDEAARGYFIRAGFFLPPVDLSPEEACALLLLTERVGGAEQLPLTRPAAAAMHKLKGGLPPALREAIGEILPRVSFHLAAAEGDSADDAWAIVSRAVAEMRTLRCIYEAANPSQEDIEAQPFHLDPCHLYWGQRAWYVIGHHHGRGECRTLRLARFTRLELTETNFEPPDGFCLEDYFGQAWRMIPGDRVRRNIKLYFSPRVAETVADTFWHPTQRIDYHDDGSITAAFEIDGLDEIVWWILGYGPHCRVIQPPELADRIARLLRDASDHYGVT